MPLCPAICTQCGAHIEVDSTHEASICRFCGTPFITEKAINKYTTNITVNNNISSEKVNITFNPELENLVSAAQGFQRLKEYEKAFQKYMLITENHPQDARGWIGCLYTYRNGMLVNCQVDRHSIGYIWTDHDPANRWLQNALTLADQHTKEKLTTDISTYISKIQQYWSTICSLTYIKSFIGNDIYVYQDSENWDYFQKLYVQNDTLFFQDTPEQSYKTYEIRDIGKDGTILADKSISLKLAAATPGDPPVFGKPYVAKQILLNVKNGDHWSKRPFSKPIRWNDRYQPKTSGHCYIATYVYGSYECPQVWTLRRFRDNHLAKSKFGKSFINFYYQTSPKLIHKYSNNTRFKKICKATLDVVVKLLNLFGIHNTKYYDK